MPRTPAVSGSQNVFAINSLTFHKVQGTFCSGGSDGSLTFWDGISRTKLKSELFGVFGVLLYVCGADEPTSFLLQGFEQRRHRCSTTKIWYSHCFYFL